MLAQVVYLLEVFALLTCIHRIYGKKIQWDVKSIVLCMSLLMIYEVVNNLQAGGIYSLVVYIPVFVYCKKTFGTSMSQTLVKIMWLIILLTAIEFLSLLVIACIVPHNLWLRNIAASFLTLIISLLLLPKTQISKVKYSTHQALGFLGILLGIIFLLTLESKLIRSINMTLFILVMPTLLMLLYLFVRWTISQEEIENMRREMSLISRMDKKYTEILDEIRIRQHGFKNHITAILSSHYTHKTYERLIKVQDEYCNRLMQENKYNNLLQVGDKVLVGFLYDKFCEMEEEGVEVKYELNASIEEYTIPIYNLVEILGILLDNAMEAAKYAEEKCVIFILSEDDNNYLFSVVNISNYVPYAEIEKWFQCGVSSKGKNRGLGLYHVKSLCQELGCDICCRNIEHEEKNWIKFSLEMGKADSK